MDYQKIYNDLISKAKSSCRSKGKGVYYEKHHIIPKCIDKNSKETVLLTAKEHFLAHRLLVKINPSSRGLAAAYWRMCHPSNGSIISANAYEEARKLHAAHHRIFMMSMKGKLHNEVSKQKISLIRKGVKVLDKTKNLQSLAKKGKPGPNKGIKFNEEWLINMSLSRKGKPSKLKGIKHCPERVEANRLRGLGKTHSEETKKKCREAMLQVKEDNLCPYCNKFFRIQTFSLFHGEKCKQNRG